MKTLSNKKCLLIICLYAISFFFIGKLIPDTIIDKLGVANLELVLDLTFAVLFFLVTKDELRGEYNIFKAELKNNIQYIFKATFKMWIICEIISIVVGLIFVISFNVEPTNNSNTEAVYKLIDQNVLIVVFLSSVTAPFIEEILFRGAIFKMFSKISDEAAVLFTALIFALLHFSADFFAGTINPTMIPALITYLVLSYTLTNYYYHHRNIFISMGIHGLYNLINILITLLIL